MQRTGSFKFRGAVNSIKQVFFSFFFFSLFFFLFFFSFYVKSLLISLSLSSTSIFQLDEEAANRGVITHSSGNHGQVSFLSYYFFFSRNIY